MENCVQKQCDTSNNLKITTTYIKKYFIIFHFGAGNMTKSQQKLNNLYDMSKNLQAYTKQQIKKHKDANTALSPIDLMTLVISFIEDSGLVNAGLGSHLNSQKDVEMDASLLYFKHHEQDNNNKVRYRFIVWNEEQERKYKNALGDQFQYDQDRMYNDKKMKKYAKFNINQKERLSEVNNDEKCKEYMKGQDTIGAIVISIDSEDKLECVIGTSSGGPWLKQPGRIGSACVRGAGFDAKYSEKYQEVYMSICSGHGENIMKNQMCSNAIHQLKKKGYINEQKFTNKYCIRQLQDIQNNTAFDMGLIGVIYDIQKKQVKVNILQTSQAFIVGYFKSGSKKLDFNVNYKDDSSSVYKASGFNLKL